MVFTKIDDLSSDGGAVAASGSERLADEPTIHLFVIMKWVFQI